MREYHHMKWNSTWITKRIHLYLLTSKYWQKLQLSMILGIKTNQMNRKEIKQWSISILLKKQQEIQARALSFTSLNSLLILIKRDTTGLHLRAFNFVALAFNRIVVSYNYVQIWSHIKSKCWESLLSSRMNMIAKYDL